ncbi:hypothetical protein KTE26_21710 [Ralstonia mannitolilytica]|uniref:hypothetical protein n=1 Tax=Ralstonia mannitolilytica TaxID=105219 RepID=UPI0013157CDE|nr:hypothetical protein [Ralstonia mannitolilytica]MBU9581054.1 hypothetical protein [Ralstonia mannitolilytica]
MSSVLRTAVGKKLFDSLGELLVGNHLEQKELTVSEERHERYMATCLVTWCFDHELTENTVAGNAALADRHFGYNTSALNAHVSGLCREARNNRDLRGRFMQRIDTDEADSLEHSCRNQLVHDFGAFTVHRGCQPCGGNGRVRCSGCGGNGKRRCGSCGGGGTRTRMVTHTRWNGRHNQTYTKSVQDTCGGCGGFGKVVCTSCGGSGKQRCGACDGHGRFTDTTHVKAIAKPAWHVPALSGLSGAALTHALRRYGPQHARRLVALELAETGYNDEDNWVVHYVGEAEVVELDVGVKKTPYTVASVGSQVTPIVTPPIFDQLLATELAHAASAQGTKRLSVRQARRLFGEYCAVPVLDAGLRAIAKLPKDQLGDSDSALRNVARGFISADTAATIGNSVRKVLDKVSPANSKVGWGLVVAAPIALGFAFGADSFYMRTTLTAGSIIGGIMLGVIAAVLATLIVSPAAWALSATVSAIARRRVPKSYRQRGRNWAPLKAACVAGAIAGMLGAGYGVLGTYRWAPRVRDAAAPAANWLVQNVQPSSPLHILGTYWLPPVVAAVPVVHQTEAEMYRDVQRLLIARGYLKGQADGNPGPRTQAAITRYRERQHIHGPLSTEQLLMHLRTH